MIRLIFAMRRGFFALLLLLATTGAVRAACTSIAVRSPLPFGVYTGVALSSTTTITVRCSKGFAYEVALGRGNGASGSARMMESGANGLRYGLYQDAARATPWGDDAGVDTVGGTGTGADQTYTVYGVLPANQRVAPGRYADGPIVASVANGPAQSLSMDVTVAATCTISAAALAFPAYSGLTVTAASDITITCTDTTPYAVGLGAGNAPGATVSSRALVLGSSQTAYALYSDAAMSLNWGVTAGNDEVSGTGNGAPQTLTVYGRIAGGQFPAPGNYADTIVATITY